MAHSTFDHLSASRRHWWLVIASGLLTLVCGTIGVWRYEHAANGHAPSELTAVASAVYHAMQMLILHTPQFEGGSNAWIEVGRWCGAFTLIATTGMFLWRRLHRELRLVFHGEWVGHYVVCGLGEKGLDVIRHLRRTVAEAHVVAIDPDPIPEHVEACDELGVFVIAGDATQAEVLTEARVGRASEVVVITPSDEKNVRIALEVERLCQSSPPQAPRCRVQMADLNLREILQRRGRAGVGGENRCATAFFDVFDHGARRILLNLPIDGRGIAPSDTHDVNVVILGFGRMGRSVALRAAKLGHFANGRSLRLNVVDRDAKNQAERFFFRYPILNGGNICDLKFHQAEAESLTARRLLEQFATETDTLLHVFVCVDENTRAAELGLRLTEILAGRVACNVAVRIKSRGSLGPILEEVRTEGPRISLFGMVEDTSDAFVSAADGGDVMARAIHEKFLAHFGVGSRRRLENDEALLPWAELREDLRESTRQQADHIAIKLRAIGCAVVETSDSREAVAEFSTAEIEVLSKIEHRRWSAERQLAGWRYGTPTDKVRRVAANIAEWDNLDESIREYDREAVRRLPDLFATIQPRLKIVRAGRG